MSSNNEDPAPESTEHNSTEHIPVLQEHLSLGKREVVSGRVRVRITNATEQQRLQADLRSEAVTVDRVPIDRELAPGEAPPVPREEEDGKVFVVPVLEEVLVVEKRLVLREELRLRRTSDTQHVEQVVAVRRQTATVDRLPPAGDPAPT